MTGSDTEKFNVPIPLRMPHGSPEAERHLAGSTVALRSIRPVAGQGPTVGFVVSRVVLRDDDEVTVVATSPGSAKAVRAGKRGGPRGRNTVDSLWDGEYELGTWVGETVVRVHRRGQCWSIWRWHDGRSWGRIWYGNLEASWRRTAMGYDTQDWALDVVAEGVPGTPNWTAGFKDEDELQWYVSQGICSTEQAESIRQVGRSLLDIVQRGGDAVSDDWTVWVPPHDLRSTLLPDGWQTSV